jgi:predicted Zn-dependent peptidase
MKFEKFTLKNGLRILVTSMPDLPSATVAIWAGVGSRYEMRSRAGIAHFFEHITFKGSKKRPSAKAVSEAVDSFGGEFNAWTDKEMTSFFIKAPTKRLSDAVDILADMTLNPLIKPEDIEREKGVIKAEIDMYQDTPLRKIYDLFESQVFKGDELAMETIGSKETVDKVSREDFLTYMNNFYYPKNMLVTVAGGVNPKKVKSLIEKYFGSFEKKGKEFKKPYGGKQTKPRFILKYKKTDQAHLIVGYRGEKYGNKDRYAEEVVQAILGGGMSSRMFTEVREKRGLAYAVKTFIFSYREAGSFLTYAGVEPAKAEEAIKTILNEFHKLTSIGEADISEKEFRKAKEYLKGQFALSLEDTSEVNSFYGFDEILGGKTRTPEEVMREIDKVKLEDIIRVAKRYFRKDRLNMAVIGPYREDKKFKKLLH